MSSGRLLKAPVLGITADDSPQFDALGERCVMDYDHLRKLAREVAHRNGFANSAGAAWHIGFDNNVGSQ